MGSDIMSQRHPWQKFLLRFTSVAQVRKSDLIFSEGLMGRSGDTHLLKMTIFLGTTEAYFVKYQNIPSTASVGTVNSKSQNQADSVWLIPRCSYGCSTAGPSHAGHRNAEVPLTPQSTSALLISVCMTKKQVKDFQIKRDAKSCRLPLTWKLNSVYNFAVHMWAKRGTKGW